MYGFLIFPSQSCYFENLVEVCGSLRHTFGTITVPVYPACVITMKRGYLFENSAGEYGEFERGDRFMMFCGSWEKIGDESLFGGLFPTEEMCMECNWERKPYRTHILRIDTLLREELCRKFIGLDFDLPRTENNWLVREHFGHYLLSRRGQDAPLAKYESYE